MQNTTTTMDKIENKIRELKEDGNFSHVLIVEDLSTEVTYMEIVPVSKTESVKTAITKQNSKHTQRVIEVYNLSMDIDEQINTMSQIWNDQEYEEKKKDERRERSSWALTWMSMALQYANHRSVDPATRHGCIFVSKENKPLSMGFNSFPRDCMDDELPLTRPEKYEVIVHSETNAIINSERSLEGATAYITGFPCPRCFSNMINAKISKLIYGPIGSHQLRDSDLELIRLLNTSATNLEPKIEIIKFSDIEDIDKLCISYDETKNYVKSKIEQTNLING